MIILFWLLPSFAFAAEAVKSDLLVLGAQEIPWLRYFPEFREGISLPLKDVNTEVAIPLSKLKIRILKGGEQSIEPLYLYLSPDDKGIEKVALKYAKKDKYHEALKEIGRLVSRHPDHKTDEKIKIQISKNLFRYLEKDTLSKHFTFLHHSLTLNAKSLRKQRQLKNDFIEEISPFFEGMEKQRILTRLRYHQSVSVDGILLPTFAKKVVRKFVVYRGPNCFHASLAFHNRALTRSRFFNVTEETGYHRAMINYDELWRTLTSNFYVVDHRIDTLRYGDILVFFDLPEGESGPVNFRWIRHTATYLFNGYTFSKGSKSADTPYTIKTLSEEWKTWSRIAKNPVVKIFRRSTKHVRKRPPKDLTDWIY